MQQFIKSPGDTNEEVKLTCLMRNLTIKIGANGAGKYNYGLEIPKRFLCGRLKIIQYQ